MSSKGYTQELLEHAILLVRSKSMSLHGASRTFNIPFSTLGDKVRGRRPIKRRPRSLLTLEEEEKLVKWIRLYAESSMKRSVDDVKDKAKEILERRGTAARGEDGRPGKFWMIGLRKRHPEISQLTAQSSGLESVGQLNLQEEICQWFADTKGYLDAIDPSLLQSPDRIFNVDQIGFSVCPNSKKILAPIKTKRWKPRSDDNGHQLTVLCSTSAIGDLAPILIIYPMKRTPSPHLLDGFAGSFLHISPPAYFSHGSCIFLFHLWRR